jgi:hypothetical protein
LAYIGNTPAENYASFLTETFSVSATANYTLSHAVANENDIRLVINGVVQQPGSGKAYTASGTTLTLTSATVSGDVMYAVYLGRALQTVNPPNASVGTAQLADSSVTSAKLGTGATNTPAFRAYASSDQAPTATVITKAQLNTENYDTDSAYDTSTYRFTPQVSGKYAFYFLATDNYTTSAASDVIAYIYKNGSSIAKYTNSAKGGNYGGNFLSTVVDMNGSSDYVEFFLYHASGGGFKYRSGSDWQYAGGYRIIE